MLNDRSHVEMNNSAGSMFHDLSLPKTSSGVTESDSYTSGGAMFAFLTKLLLIARSRLKSRARLEAENLVLRQQVIVLSRKSPSRVRLRNIDRLIFVWPWSPKLGQHEQRLQGWPRWVAAGPTTPITFVFSSPQANIICAGDVAATGISNEFVRIKF